MNFLLLLPLAFIGGMAVPAQFAINSQLRNVVGGPVSAAAVSFIIGAVALSVAAVFVSRTVPRLGEVAGAPWWVWTGGLLGAVYVLASIILTPRLGAAATVGFFLAGQMAASVTIDHFGLLGAATQEITLPRSLGLVFVLAGVFLIQRF